jgi:radical SAM superfamily enzyme YgiQ (UPF0313 family)
MKIKTFVFYDDALLINSPDHIQPLLDEIIERKMVCTFHTPNGLHAQRIDKDVGSALFRSGFKTVRLSFETANTERQTEMGSKVTKEDLATALDHLRAAGYKSKELEVYVLAGLPGQPFEEMMESILFVARCGAKVRLALYSPIPGTREWEKGVRFFGFDPQADPLLHNNTILPFFTSTGETSSIEQLQGLVKILNAAIDQDVNFIRPSALSNAFQKALKKWA